MSKLFRIFVISGALDNSDIIKQFNHAIHDEEDFDEYGKLIEIVTDVSGVRLIKKHMIRHLEDKVPWYLDGDVIGIDKHRIVVFGADDGMGGKEFIFDVNDKNKIDSIIKYGTSLGIPKGELDFMEYRDSKKNKIKLQIKSGE